LKTLDIAISGICGALYGILGYLTYLVLPITAPGIGVVRFWPPVIIPAIVAVLFGPLSGGIGAAIGIFISDILIHGDPVLSLTAGVTSNFVGFYIIGYLYRKSIDWKKMITYTTVTLTLICTILGYILLTYISLNASILFTSLSIASYIIALAIGHFWKEWRSYGIASIIGLGIGSTIIGFVVWAYSQIFTLPLAVGEGPFPIYVAFVFLIWTFATEIPFLIILGPPILRSCFKAFPSLRHVKKED
jgi:uncharacterized membrane protein